VVDSVPLAHDPSLTMAYFSGGLDSFFSVLTDNPHDHPERSYSIDELVFVRGFDTVATQNARVEAGWPRLHGSLQSAADQLGKPLRVVRTNIRLLSPHVPFLPMSGLILAGVGLMLEARYRRAILSSSDDYRNLIPRGIHPFSTRLYSTRQLQFIHDGGGVERFEKTRVVVQSAVAQQTLHVCWNYAEPTDQNCGNCPKCWRTMVALDALGALERFKTFARYDYQPLLARAMLPTIDHPYLKAVRPHALANGRTDIVRTIDSALAQRQQTRRQRIEQFLSQWVMPSALAHAVGDGIDAVYRSFHHNTRQRRKESGAADGKGT
jgi:hypothetical protein